MGVREETPGERDPDGLKRQGCTENAPMGANCALQRQPSRQKAKHRDNLSAYLERCSQRAHCPPQEAKSSAGCSLDKLRAGSASVGSSGLMAAQRRCQDTKCLTAYS